MYRGSISGEPFSVTWEGRAGVVQNGSDLATVVWEEVRLIEDKEVRAQVVRGIAKRLAAKYQAEIESNDSKELTVKERAIAIAKFFEKRGIPVTVNSNDVQSNLESDSRREPFPIIQLHGCPYPGLSESDDLICEMEQGMFSELSGCEVELHRCNQDSTSDCCSFHLDTGHLETAEKK